MNTITKVILLCLFISNTPTKAQRVPDGGLWSTFSLEFALNKKFGMFVTEEIRFKENLTRVNLFYTNVGLEYKIVKGLKTSLSYRPTQKITDENLISHRHRIQWDVAAKKSFGNFDLSYRHRLQAEVKNFFTSDNGNLMEWYSRNKVQLKYDFDKPLTPYLSIEMRYQIRDARSPESNYVWHRSRYQGGFDYEINSHNLMGAYYMFQEEYNIADPESQQIIGLEYTYKF